MSDEHTFLTGVLLNLPSGDVTKEWLLQRKRFEFREQIEGCRWEDYIFRSPKPLLGEQFRDLSTQIQYPVVCRRSGSRILILSLSRSIVDHIIQNELSELHRVSIAIDALVKALVAKPTLYSLSYAHGRTPAYGVALQSAAFWGQDLADAALFRDQTKLTTYFICGLKPATTGSEIVRLSRDGRISFFRTESGRFLQIEEVLRFLRQENYLQSEIW